MTANTITASEIYRKVKSRKDNLPESLDELFIPLSRINSIQQEAEKEFDKIKDKETKTISLLYCKQEKLRAIIQTCKKIRGDQ